MPFKELSPDQKPWIISRLSQDSEHNCFLLGNLSQFLPAEKTCAVSSHVPAGTPDAARSNTCTVYLVAANDEALTTSNPLPAGGTPHNALVVKYHQYFSIEASASVDLAPALHECIEALGGMGRHGTINVQPELMEALAVYYPDCLQRQFKLAALHPQDYVKPQLKEGYALTDDGRYSTPDGTEVQFVLAHTEHLQGLVELMSEISEFKSDYKSPEGQAAFISSKQEQLDIGWPTIVGLHQNRVVATASVTSMSNSCAMIIGVATHPQLRGHGLATQVVAQLIETCFSRQVGCLELFFNNPDAARIYFKFGFSACGYHAQLQPAHTH